MTLEEMWYIILGSFTTIICCLLGICCLAKKISRDFNMGNKIQNKSIDQNIINSNNIINNNNNNLEFQKDEDLKNENEIENDGSAEEEENNNNNVYDNNVDNDN